MPPVVDLNYWHTRKRKRTLEEMYASLPVEDYVIDLPEEEKQNENGVRLVCIGQEYMRTELVIERAKARVVKYYRKVYADRELENETGDTQIVKPSMLAPLLAHSYVSASVATDILVRKYADGMPLYRQEQMWKRMGVALSRNTMANWVIQIALPYLLPLWESMREALRLGPSFTPTRRCFRCARRKAGSQRVNPVCGYTPHRREPTSRSAL